MSADSSPVKVKFLLAFPAAVGLSRASWTWAGPWRRGSYILRTLIPPFTQGVIHG